MHISPQLTIVSYVFMRIGTDPLMFIRRVYNISAVPLYPGCIFLEKTKRKKQNKKVREENKTILRLFFELLHPILHSLHPYFSIQTLLLYTDCQSTKIELFSFSRFVLEFISVSVGNGNKWFSLYWFINVFAFSKCQYISYGFVKFLFKFKYKTIQINLEWTLKFCLNLIKIYIIKIKILYVRKQKLLLTDYRPHGNLISDKVEQEFFQTVAVSILLYGCTLWTPTKRLENERDWNYARMLRAD